jgi:hypothetical protein
MITRTSSRLLLLLIVSAIVGCSDQESTPAATQTAAVNTGAADSTKGLDYEFYKESVEPIFIRYRGGFVGADTACVACHTVQANAPLGLVPLVEENGEVFWTEEQSRQNFENVAMLVNPSAPETSRLLMAPLAPIAGGESHSGGIFWDSPDHSEYRLIAEWIASGDPSATADPIVEVDFEFYRSCVQPIFVNPIDNAMPCTECHSGQFAIPNPANSYWTEEQSRQSFEEILSFVDPGRPDYSRFLHKPLHPNAGGDLMHNGGRRWYSTDDPERQALEAWVRGDATGNQCPSALQFDFPPRP